MKWIIFVLLILIFVSCEYILQCPNDKMAGVWKYENENNDEQYIFNDVDNFCEYIRVAEYHYLWSLKGGKITLQPCTSVGLKLDSMPRTYDIEINKNYLIIDGKKYTRR
jgi:hypothetical protein